MPHTYSQNLVHIVFSTKERRKLISKDHQEHLWSYLGGICKHQTIFIHAIGGMDDHVHFLLQIPPSLPLAKAVLLLKSNSSRWMKEQGHKFAWQQGYGAFSVSASNAGSVIRYIRNQEQHHKKMSFDNEFLLLLKKHGIAFDPKYVFG